MSVDGSSAGVVHLWTYPEGGRDYPGWHLHADKAGCDRLAAALDELLVDRRAQPEFAIAPVTAAVLALPNNRQARARSARALRLKRALLDEGRFALEESEGDHGAPQVVEAPRAEAEERAVDPQPLVAVVVGAHAAEGDARAAVSTRCGPTTPRRSSSSPTRCTRR